ncbi:MAG: DUF4296 domain-containing protein [Bacteroidetes bacterium]|nr:DUF4296 domain-containing protein [Bacteroidota bacterium]
MANKINIIFFFIVLLLINGCHTVHKDDFLPPPENLIPKDKMIDILVDIQLIESAIKADPFRKQNLDFYVNYYYDYLFKKYTIQRKDFEESLKYYQQNIEEFDKLFADVITRLSKLQSEVNNQQDTKAN